MKKVIWITGGGTGIGKAVAIKFANQGWNVAISGRRENILKEVEDINPNTNAQQPALPDFTIDASPYRWLTYDEFTYHVDMMRGNVYDD